NEIAVDLEEAPQLGTRIAAAKPVGSERDVRLLQPRPYLVRYVAHVVGLGDDRAVPLAEQVVHEGAARRRVRMQQVPALACERLAAQLAEARDRIHIGRDAEVTLQDIGRRQAFAQDRTAAEQRGA